MANLTLFATLVPDGRRLKYERKKISELIDKIWGADLHRQIVIKNNAVLITASENGSIYPELTFQILKKISDFFETENIRDEGRYQDKGWCSTSDYTTVSEFTLKIW